MGDSGLNAQTTMKFALVVCFAALVACEPEAKPEAEADAYYGYYGHPYAYGGYRAYGYGAYPYAHHGLYYGKRSADAEPTAAAEPNADAYYYGAYGLGYHGLGYRSYGYAGYPYAHAYGHYYGKRSAEAEPAAAAEPEADAYYGYYGYGARPYYGYGLGYRGYAGYHGLGYRSFWG